MLDLHSHILPGLDDGAATLEQSLEMAQIAVEDGIQGVVCTPHWSLAQSGNTRDRIMCATRRLAEQLDARQIPLTLYPGAELRLDSDLPQSIQDGKLLTINDTGCFALIELPETILPPGLEEFLWELRRRRITPIISHPERNYGFYSNPMALYRLVRMGVLTQITCASVLGHFGARVKAFSLLLLKQRWCHVLASDAHGRRQRTPRLTEGRRMVEKVVGKQTAWQMVDETPRLIVAGQSVHTPEPAEFRRPRLRFWQRPRIEATW